MEILQIQIDNMRKMRTMVIDKGELGKARAEILNKEIRYLIRLYNHMKGVK